MLVSLQIMSFSTWEVHTEEKTNVPLNHPLANLVDSSPQSKQANYGQESNLLH